MSTTPIKKKAAPAVSKIDLSGLSKFSLQETMEGGLRAAGGRPLDIPIDEIEEDAQQARGNDNPGFSEESLAELAASISEGRGVKTPISVRSKNAEGKHVINHGARRYRASKLAGMTTIHAFIDDSHDDYDQAVENIQREAFTPMEIALFIQKREKAGDSRSAIAKRIGKDKSFVTRHAALVDLVPELRALYDSGRTRDYQMLYSLAILFKEHPDAVVRLVEGDEEITRSTVESLRATLKEPQQPIRDDSSASKEASPAMLAPSTTSSEIASWQDDSSGGSKAEAGTTTGPQAKRQGEEVEAAVRTKKQVVMVSRKKSLFVLRVDLAPSALHLGWVEDPATGKKSEVELADLRIDSIVSR